MPVKVTRNPDGLVARDIEPTGERAWRLSDDGKVNYCADHKGPWVGCNWSDVPERVRTALSFARQFAAVPTTP